MYRIKQTDDGPALCQGPDWMPVAWAGDIPAKIQELLGYSARSIEEAASDIYSLWSIQNDLCVTGVKWTWDGLATWSAEIRCPLARHPLHDDLCDLRDSFGLEMKAPAHEFMSACDDPERLAKACTRLRLKGTRHENLIALVDIYRATVESPWRRNIISMNATRTGLGRWSWSVSAPGFPEITGSYLAEEFGSRDVGEHAKRTCETAAAMAAAIRITEAAR